MDVGVDETRRYELAFGVDGLVDLAVEVFADMDDLVALVDNDAVTDKSMAPAVMAYDPASLDGSAHSVSFSHWLHIPARERAPAGK